jgi:two-component system, chemotaxis family, protein-glutamate methylesterase/glutaminase
VTGRVVVMGSSLGGLEALRYILSELPKDLNASVIVVQHRSADSSDDRLLSYCAKRSALPVRSIEDKSTFEPGYVYLAPADYHLLIEEDRFALSTEGPVQFSRPSIDVLFESAAHEHGPRVVGVILTGSNADGAAGLASIVKGGGKALVQDPASASRGEMPLAALEATKADEVLCLEDIPSAIAGLVGTRS